MGPDDIIRSPHAKAPLRAWPAAPPSPLLEHQNQRTPNSYLATPLITKATTTDKNNDSTKTFGTCRLGSRAACRTFQRRLEWRIPGGEIDYTNLNHDSDVLPVVTQGPGRSHGGDSECDSESPGSGLAAVMARVA